MFYYFVLILKRLSFVRKNPKNVERKIFQMFFKIFCLLVLMKVPIKRARVSDPYSFFTDPDPDPEDPDGGQYGSRYGSGSGSNPDPGLQ
jgi:hypothetical protein